MPFTIHSLVRLIVSLVVVANLLAIAASRLAPPPPDYRYPEPVDLAAVNGYYTRPRNSDAVILRAGDGSRRTLASPDPTRKLDHPSLSPWTDPEGHRQVIARWSRRGDAPEDPDDPPGSAIVRLRYPSGELIESVTTQVVPIAPPAWMPGTSARAIFVAGDGQLYRFAFEDEPGVSRRDERPVAVDWEVEPPGAGKVMITDANWAAPVKGTRDLVLATLSVLRPEGERTRYGAPEIWWLRLDPSGSAIVAAGPMLAGEPGAGMPSLRNPMLARAADGKPFLLYNSRDGVGNTWQLRATSVRFDPETGVPSARHGESRVVFEGAIPSTAAVSADRRWVAAACPDDREGFRVVRAPLSPASAEAVASARLP